MSDAYLQERFQNLHEFVKVARQNLDRNNWDYLIGGSETETTLARNRLALDSIGLRNPSRDCFASLAMTVAAATLRLGRPARCRYDRPTTTLRRGDAPSAPPHPHPKHPFRRNPRDRP